MNTKYLSQLLFRFLSVSAVLLLAFSPFGGALAQESATYTVNTTNDSDDGVCNKAHCSLREAINLANTHPGADKIVFKISGGPPFTIQPLSALQDITDPVTIDGTTQPGFHGTPIVELDGTYAGEVVGGLVIVAGDSTVRGLVINRFYPGDGIVLTDNGGNTIQGNFIGTDVTGTVHLGNYRGVLVEGGSSGNLIGGTGAHAGNLLSGNEGAGVRLSDAGTEGNKVQGNFIGTDLTGMTRLGNNIGVRITEGAAYNLIGGAEAGARNVISGNDDIGVYIDIEEVEGTTGNIVQGNYIGTNVIGSSTTGPAVGEYTVTALEETCPTYPAETDFDGWVSGSDDPAAPWSGTFVHFVGTDGCSNEMLGEASLIYRYRLEFAEETQLTSIAVAGANFNGPESILRVLDEDKNVLGSTDTFGGNFFTVHFVTLQNVVGKVFFIEEFDTSTTWRYRERILINASPLGNYYSGVGLAGGASGNLIMQNVISGNLGDGVGISDPGTMSNTLQGNFIGTDLSGNIALPNISSGVWISDAESNLIAGNVVSGNGSSGIGIWGIGSTGNVIRGNLIGTNADGTAPLPNSDGIWMGGEASGNIIGGTTAEERNVISGNTYIGVSIWDTGTSENIIQGNFIGTDANGTAALPNTDVGIWIGSGASNTLIGGTEEGARNVISGNATDGVLIADPGTSENKVQGNFIGTDANGTAALPNGADGVRIRDGASGNLIGGIEPNAGNLISGNRDSGVRIADAGTEGNKVQGNLIGTDINGTGPLGNGYIGIQVTDGAADNLIGGTEDGARNVISDNNDSGVLIRGATGNKVQGNFIGTDITGTSPLGNRDVGIWVSGGATDNEIGGTEDGARNVISGNNFAGVAIAGNGTTGNTVQGNYIGTDRDGSVALANVIGVLIVGDATGNLIGGTEASARNVISGNPYNVIFAGSGGATGNTLQGNYIGLDRTGSVILPNTDIGVLIFEGSANNLIGGTEPGAGNFISGSARWGVAIGNSGVTGNIVQGNFIGTDASGTQPLGNLGGGVYIDDNAADNLIGGTEPGAGNTIAFNGSAGIGLGPIEGGTTAGSGNSLLSNSLFSNGGLGIDLGADGVTPNDPLDSDTGPNDLQNFPIITTVRRVGRAMMIYGTLESTPSTIFRLEFFSNVECDPSGYGEGQAFLGFGHVKTNRAGIASFIITLPVPLPQGAFVTATATDPGGSTSEFSACFAP